MRYKKGYRNQKGAWGEGRWMMRHKLKRTCRNGSTTMAILDDLGCRYSCGSSVRSRGVLAE